MRKKINYFITLLFSVVLLFFVYEKFLKRAESVVLWYENQEKNIKIEDFKNKTIFFIWSVDERDSYLNIQTVSYIEKLVKQKSVAFVYVAALKDIEEFKTYDVYAVQLGLNLNDLAYDIKENFKKKYDIKKYPSILIFDKNNLIYRKEGYIDWSKKENLEEIKKVLE